MVDAPVCDAMLMDSRYDLPRVRGLELVRNRVHWKAGEELTADALTKILPRARLEKLRSKLGVLVSRRGR